MSHLKLADESPQKIISTNRDWHTIQYLKDKCGLSDVDIAEAREEGSRRAEEAERLNRRLRINTILEAFRHHVGEEPDEEAIAKIEQLDIKRMHFLFSLAQREEIDTFRTTLQRVGVL